MVVFGEAALRRVLKAYASYQNRVRTHLSLDKDAPLLRRSLDGRQYRDDPNTGWVHHHYVRIWIFGKAGDSLGNPLLSADAR